MMPNARVRRSARESPACLAYMCIARTNLLPALPTRGWRAVSAAALQGQGSQKRCVFFTDTARSKQNPRSCSQAECVEGRGELPAGVGRGRGTGAA